LEAIKVKFLDFSRLYTHYQDELDAAMKRCLVTGKLILQDDVEEFERRFAEYLGVKYVVGLNSGTDALLMALIAAGVGEGDEVVTVSNTFIATIQVIHHLGAKPILVDVGWRGLMGSDEPSLDRAINNKTKAIIPVHLAGDTVDIKWLKSMSSAIKVGDNPVIIEDAAQAVGAAGVGLGDMQCYSFYPAKILGTFGDAGALATNSEAVYERVKSLRNHGGVQKYEQGSYEYGWNSRLDNIWAATLNVKLDYLDTDLAKRKAIAEYYNSQFNGLPMKLPIRIEGRVYQDYIIQPEEKGALANYLRKSGIETLGWTLPNHKHPGLGLDHYELPVTEKIIRDSLRLPCNQFLDGDEIEYVAHKVKEYYL